MSSTKELWRRLQNASRKERELIINSLDSETLNKLRTEVNPYKKPVSATGKKTRMLAYHFINMEELYMKRFVMTSLIGYLYRSLDEYTPDCKYPSEQDFEFSKLFEEKARRMEFEITQEKYQKLINGAETEDKQLEYVIKLYKYRNDREKYSGIIKPDEDAMYAGAKRRYEELTDTDARHLQYSEESLTEDMVESLIADTKAELKIEKTAEEFHIEQRDIIQQFLDKHFMYNPDEHVREAYKPHIDDDTRTLLEHTLSEDVRARNMERLVLPPDDTFSRWNRYITNNYEHLRKATDDIYCEKATFETAIAPMEVFEGEDEDSCLAQFEKYKKKYADEMDTEITCVSMGNWTFTAPWQRNRDKTEFYNEKTELMKRIIDQSKEDARIGQKLIKKRALKGVGQSVTDHLEKPKVADYGVSSASDMKIPNIIETELPNDPEESTNKEIEIEVHKIRPVFDRHQKRIRAKMEKWKFNSPAVKPDEGTTIGGIPKKMKEVIAKAENQS